MHMAKKRGRKRKSEPVNKHELPGGWGRQIFAFILIVIAFVLVVSWFQKDGALLVSVHEMLSKVFGFASYIIPPILIYLAVQIFRANGNRIDPVIWVASGLMLVWISGICGIPGYETEESTGGALGDFLNNFAIDALGGLMAGFVYFVLILITGFFMYAVTKAFAITFRSLRTIRHML